MTEIEININKYAQNKLTDSEIMDWFDQFDLTNQKEIRNKLSFFIQQSKPTEDLINKAIVNTPIKMTLTPVVIFKTHKFKVAISKIEKLPDSELRKSIIVMLSIFKTTDSYRRDNFCKNSCTHEWHNLIN